MPRNALRRALLTLLLLVSPTPFAQCAAAAENSPSAAKPQPLKLDWKNKQLTISGPNVPGGAVGVFYLEAYCRPGSTNADWWSQTIIPHGSERLADSDDGRTINLIDRLEDGVVVTHRITSTADDVTFSLVAKNPTKTESKAHWAQPCIRVKDFTGCQDRSYLPQCFVFLNSKLTRLPTKPWATQAILTPGQVYRPRHVPAADVNPRPVSTLETSNGLIGCYSADGRWILATAWEPYQELFQGVATCIHSDLRIGGLKPGEKKEIRGRIYITDQGAEKLVDRYERDFPEQIKH